jgi:hypothetical protein
MHPDALGGSGVWSVGVFDNEGQTLSPGRELLPAQGKRKVGPLAGVLARNGAITGKGTRM